LFSANNLARPNSVGFHRFGANDIIRRDANLSSLHFGWS
jgi:hypothetical protein